LEIQIGKSGVVNSKLYGFDELFETNKAPAIEPVVYIPAERAGMMRAFKQILRLYVATNWLSAPPHERRAIQLMSERVRLPGVSRLFLNQLLDTERSTQKEREEAYVAPALDLLEREDHLRTVSFTSFRYMLNREPVQAKVFQ